MPSTARTNAASGRSTDTRALLASLQELRDSLSIRVNQLALAVERLRAQAGELERGLAGSVAGSGMADDSRPRRFSGALQVPAPRQPVQMAEGDHGPALPRQSYTSTSAIASEVSQLDRPITSAEIHRLLDRASASLADAPDLEPDDPEREETIESLRQARDSLQGGIAELQGMGETQARLRQRLRESREMIVQAELDLNEDRTIPNGVSRMDRSSRLEQLGQDTETASVDAFAPASDAESDAADPIERAAEIRRRREDAARFRVRRLDDRAAREAEVARRVTGEMNRYDGLALATLRLPQSRSGSGRPSSPPEETLQHEAERRLSAIRTRRANRTVEKQDSRADRLAWRDRIERAKRARQQPKPARSGLVPTNLSGKHEAVIVRSEGVTPPPARVKAEDRATSATQTRAGPSRPSASAGSAVGTSAIPARSTERTAADHPVSLDSIQSQISELDLNLEPADYMENLSRIIRSAMTLPSTGDPSRSGNGNGGISMMIIDTNGQVLHDTLPGWGPPESPSSPTSSVGSTVLGNDADAALTYRGRDVQDRIRGSERGTGSTTPDISGLLGEELGREAVRRIQDRVAAMMEPASTSTAIVRRRPAGSRDAPRANVDIRRVESVPESAGQHEDGSRALVSAAARSARELVRAASRRDTQVPVAIPVIDRLTDRSTTYEMIAQTELRMAQAQRTRAYNRYQDLLSSRARREPRVSVSPPRRTRSPWYSPELGLASDDQAGSSDLAVAQPEDPDEADARQELVVAQMREGRAQQRLIWARSRMRRDTAVDSADSYDAAAGHGDAGGDGSGASSTSIGRLGELEQRMIEADQQIDALRADIVHAQEMAESRRQDRTRTATNSSNAENVPPTAHSPGRSGVSIGLGPRNEQPEDVDTLVRIRQLQANRPRAIEIVEARRQRLAALRQNLTESRQRIREAAGEVAGADRGDATMSETADPFESGIEGNSNRSMLPLLDESQISETSRNLLHQLQGVRDTTTEVTPSSPHTARSEGGFPHITISTGTNTRSERAGSGGVNNAEQGGTGAVGARMDNEAEEEDELEHDDDEGYGANHYVVAGSGTGEAIPLVRGPVSGLEPFEDRQGLTDKSTLEYINPTPTLADDTQLRADEWQPPPRARRRERVYISLLDL